MTIIYQFLQFYFLISMRIQQSVLIIIVKASTLIIRSAVRAFTDTFRRPINRFLQFTLYFSLLILSVDSYFALFRRLCFSARECAHLMGKISLGLVVVKLECLVISFNNSITSSIWFFLHWESLHN